MTAAGLFFAVLYILFNSVKQKKFKRGGGVVETIETKVVYMSFFIIRNTCNLRCVEAAEIDVVEALRVNYRGSSYARGDGFPGV